MSTQIVNGVANHPLAPLSPVEPAASLLTPYFAVGKISMDEVFNAIEWERRDAVIEKYGSSEKVFEQKNIEVPKSWSDSALKIVAQKYFKGPLDSPKRETSVKQLISRVVLTIVRWGVTNGYFDTATEAQQFAAELGFLLVNQYAAFNSPVWFNVGTEFASNPEHPQCSACFINSVEDTMAGDRGILSVVVREGLIFKDGSGSGINLYKLRSSKEKLSSGGKPSGPVSFMRTFDTNAGQIKSGGKTRRAAKMVILNVDHGDILQFIDCKMKEENRAKQLIELGYSSSFDDAEGAYGLVFFQNANHSVRVDDDFMRAVEADGEYWLRARNEATGSSFGTGGELEKVRARDLFRKMAQAAWNCGDPGIQFDSTINKWNPVLDTQRINSSNPCSEYMFVDDSACNLASLNLMKFVDAKGKFNYRAFRAACRTVALAMEILVGESGYPTELIAQNSYDYRPLGLGYANLGSLLMTSGVAYDSDYGRHYAAAVTSLMGAAAYEMSAEIARKMGPFKYWSMNDQSFLRVIGQHRDAAINLEGRIEHMGGLIPEWPHIVDVESSSAMIADFATSTWTRALELGSEYGYRNGQMTVLAPTGTIGFMMDCQTTGIEPELALTKYKTLVGGGTMKLVNTEVARALKTLGYTGETFDKVVEYIAEHGTPEGCEYIDDVDLPVFDTSFPAQGYERAIDPMGHVRMMAAVQPFLSGAISKTVNMPEAATVEDVEEVYLESWKLGVKALAIYRNNCKSSQPLSTKASEGVDNKAGWKLIEHPTLEELAAKITPENRHAEMVPVYRTLQRKMPQDRQATVHEATVAGLKMFITMGMFEDKTLGEIFIEGPKEGSTISGLLRALAVTTSMYLQFGGPLDKLVAKLAHMSFAPAGITSNPDIRFVESPVDYIAKLLARKFVDQDVQSLESGPASEPEPLFEEPVAVKAKSKMDIPTKFCLSCGAAMKPSGSCWTCQGCGSTSGGCS
jgi:ribonucleoside-diphosphate reductase alpha chain